MLFDLENYKRLKNELEPFGATLIAVSKSRPADSIKALYDQGQRDFGENYVNELLEKSEALPNDIRWHFIGHLQSNKVKPISAFVHLIHGIDSLKLLKEINKQALACGRIQPCLLQIHIASEETKFGFSFTETNELMSSTALEELSNIQLCGLMGMASNTSNEKQVRDEFRSLKLHFEELKQKFKKHTTYFNQLSMGMTSDYRIALEEGSTMIRIGTAIFGERILNK